MRRMRNYNLEIRITDSSCRPQLKIPRLQDFIFPTYGRYSQISAVKFSYLCSQYILVLYLCE